jgi:molybdopterin-guanine dinucleotide biosynthesis protein A
MTELTSCAGVVLAGGKSERMGAEKAALPIGGEALLARIVRRLRLALPEVYIIGPSHLKALAPDTPLFPDDFPGLGPLGGLSTALAHIASQHIFVVGCDMPFVESALVGAMARAASGHPEVDVVALRTARGAGGVRGAGGLEPLHAVYARTCAPLVQERSAAADGRSLVALLERLRLLELPASSIARYDPAGRSTFNANSPDEWREALAIQAQESDTPSSRM